MVKPIPEGFHTVTPHLTVKDAAAAIEFYKKAFGAEEIARMPGPDGKIMYAELRIGNSPLMLNDEFPEMGSHGPKAGEGSAVTVHLYVNDCDAFFDRAVKAGAQAKLPPQDMFWGDRYAKVKDPSGHQWGLATHIEDIAPQECARRAAAWKPG